MVLMTHSVQEAGMFAGMWNLFVVLSPPPPPISVRDNCQGFGPIVLAMSANDLRLARSVHRIKRSVHA